MSNVLHFPPQLAVAEPQPAPEPVRCAAVSFIHHQTPPNEWVEELRAISPKSDEHGFLDLVWEPGDPWVPGQRWVIYQMLHHQFADWAVVRELEGPHPRSEGHMCSVKVPKQFCPKCAEADERSSMVATA